MCICVYIHVYVCIWAFYAYAPKAAKLVLLSILTRGMKSMKEMTSSFTYDCDSDSTSNSA